MADWLDSREEGWGGSLANFVLCEHDVLGSKKSTSRSKISGVRLSHIISGVDYFTIVGSRRRSHLEGLEMTNKTANHRLPFNTVLLDFARRKLGIETEGGLVI